METDLALPPDAEPTQRLIASFISRQKKATAVAYFAALGDFQVFMGAPNMATALADMLSSRGRAHELADEYIGHMMARGLSGSTINQRLSALRSILNAARVRDLIDWKLETKGKRTEVLRDTRGPGIDGVRACLAAAEGTTPIARRNYAILRLLFDLGLRREEVSRLDMEDLDVVGNRINVMGKGRDGKVWMNFGAGEGESSTLAAMRAWVDVRGSEPGALFINYEVSGTAPKRLTGSGIYYIVRRVGAAAGFPIEEHRIAPHKFRHASVSQVLALSGGNLRAAQLHARHKDPKMTVIYDDNRLDVQGTMARLLADDIARRKV